MSPERWQQVQRIFLVAEDAGAGDRAAVLDAACGDDELLRKEVEALLDAASESGDFLEAAVVNAASGVTAAADSSPVNSRIGPYEVQRKIGDGGMGAVYLARRADQQFEKQVAIKLVRIGLDTPELLSRFRTERQILAGLDHPHIARMLDGGTTTDGRPYVVMEYIEGAPIDLYLCERALPVRERLRIFLDVCAAVEHAHRNLIVHRDIKPANVLVTPDGTAKLLDFGIAKLLAAEPAEVTRVSERLMTPEFASPEQIRGEAVTTATDVYSLGVLLYAIIAGRNPYARGDSSPAQLEARICEMDAPPIGPGAGDLEAITAMAMRKDPAGRYHSVGQLIDDIHRHLDGFPVMARKGAWRYRAGKFVRRHRSAVIAAALAVVMLVGFAVTMMVQAKRIREERDTAERERREAQQVSDYLGKLFRSLNTDRQKGGATTAREMLDGALATLDRDLKGQSDVQAHLLDIMGQAYESLGVYDKAEESFTRALKIRRSLADGLALAGTLKNLAETLRLRTKFTEAEQAARESLEIRRRLLGTENADVAESVNTLGMALWQHGEAAQAEPLFREALRIREKVDGPGNIDAVVHMSNLAGVLRNLGDYAGSAEMYRRVVALRREKLGEDHPRTALALNGLGLTLISLGKYAEAESSLRLALGLRGKLLGEGHPDYASTKADLAEAIHKQGRLVEAETLHREVLRRRRELNGDSDHPRTAMSLNWLGTVLADEGKLAEGESLIRQSLGMRQRLLGERNIACAQSLEDLARVLVKRGDNGGAHEAARKASEIRREKLGASHPDTVAAEKLARETASRRR